MSLAKNFENLIREQLGEIENSYVLRLYDTTSNFKGITNPADFIGCYRDMTFLIECKTLQGASINFNSDIRPNQWSGLLDAYNSAPKNMICGVLVWFYTKDVTIFIPISLLNQRKEQGKKSIRFDDPEVIQVNGAKRVKYYVYDFESMFDTAKQFKIGIIGNRYSKLVVISEETSVPHRNRIYNCVCDCGNMALATKSHLTSGHTKSCGCLNKEKIVHGMARTRLYNIWGNMKARCNNVTNTHYANYGARGITVCDSWKNSFEAFRDDLYESYQKHVEEFGEKDTTIDRIDVNGNYCKENCKWSTKKEQSYNKRGNVLLEFRGKQYTLEELAKFGNMRTKTLWSRLNKLKWDIEKAVTTPVKERRSK